MSTVPPKSQSERFVEAARALKADEDEDAFKAKLATIARQMPKPNESAPVKKRGKE